jgi:hypothetical protein
MIKRDGINPGGTHFPILAAAVARTKGPVMEFGVGDYSTPMLHLMLKGTGRQLTSCDNNEEWLTVFADLYSDEWWHRFRLCYDWEKWGEIPHYSPISVAFIDCAPEEGRIQLLKSLADRAHFVVAHDLEAWGIGWAKCDSLYKYKTIWKAYPTWTGVYSNFEEFKL